MNKVIGILCIAVFCSNASAQKANGISDKVLIDQGKKNTLEMLKDPDSAKFRGVFLMNGTNVCGELNAKNSYGGYGGYKRFYSINKDYSRIDNGEDFDVSWQIFCVKQKENQEISKADPLPSIELEK